MVTVTAGGMSGDQNQARGEDGRFVADGRGGGVGFGEVMNGGFGMLIDGSLECDEKIKSMLFWDVNNGINRRAWARNEGAIFAIKRAMEKEPRLKVTIANIVDEDLL